MFEPINLEDLFTTELKDPEFLIDRLLGESELGLISGQAKRNKTFLVIALALSIAYGVPFAGEFHVRRARRVLLILNEDGTSHVTDRIEKLLRGLGLDPAALPQGQLQVLCRRGFRFSTEDLDWLRDYITERNISCVVFDPFAEMFSGVRIPAQVVH